MYEIASFSGEYRFLSNFYPSIVKYDDIEYPTVEHAYQAAKTLVLDDREIVKSCPTAAIAKKLSKSLIIRPNWDIIKLEIMAELVFQKFENSTTLQQKLSATGNAILIEGNHWGDTFWGICKGVGDNNLGKLLMSIRGIYQ